jgi:hypothetical protein
MTMAKVEYHIRGLCPAMMHNGQLADPLNRWSRAIKEISKKRLKTDEDIAEISRLEWFGSLYVNEDGHPCWPGENIEAMVRGAARKEKRGKDVEECLLSDGNWVLIYDGPKDAQALWDSDQYRDTRRAKNPNGKGTILRTRPIFRTWELKFVVEFDTDILNVDDVHRFVEVAGRRIGLSDYRPKFGKFEIVKYTVLEE